MSAARFQITTFNKNSQFHRTAQQSIHAGITAEQLPDLLDVEPDSVDMRVALEMTTQEGRKYSFKDKSGHFCQLELARS